MSDPILDLTKTEITPSVHDLRIMLIRDYRTETRGAADTLAEIKKMKLGPKEGEFCPTWRKIIRELHRAAHSTPETATDGSGAGEYRLVATDAPDAFSPACAHPGASQNGGHE